MTEDKVPYQAEKDKGNGKDQQSVAQIEDYLFIGRFTKTGQVALKGKPIDELIKFREKKTKDEILDILLDAMIVVRNLGRQVEKKSPLLRVTKGLFLPGGSRG